MNQDSKGLNLPKQITKFLSISDEPKYLRYVFGHFDIYIESITTLLSKEPHRAQFQRPALLVARFDSEQQIRLLLEKADKRLQLRRVFKSMWTRAKNRDRIDGFIKNCAKNLLHLAEGKTLRIHAKDNLELQKHFYDVFVKTNEEEKTNCKFDFDVYDVLFWIKEYVDGDKVWLVTSVEGLAVA
jgi:hypothetical protein